MSILKTLELSTAHVKPSTLNPPHKTLLLAAYPEGAFFVVPQDDEDWKPYRDVPDDLLTVLKTARRLECDLVRFDCDADLYEGLATYVWEN